MSDKETNFHILHNSKRLTALDKSGMMDDTIDEAYDMLTKQICSRLNVPVAAISLIDGERQFFKSQAGMKPHIAEVRGTPVDQSVCQNVVYKMETLAINDLEDSREFEHHPARAVLDTAAYLGEPLFFEGEAIGAVCAVDNKPHEWTEEDREVLRWITQEIQTEMYYRKFQKKD